MTSRRRRVTAGGGVALAVAGLVLPLIGTVRLPAAASLLFTFLVVGIGVPALLVRRLDADDERASLPVPERPLASTVPGEAFDDLLADATLDRRGEATFALRRVHDRLRTVAADTLAAREGISVDAATRLLDENSWTDDDIAAAFLRDSPDDVASGGPLFERIRRGNDPLRDAVDRTAAAIVRTAGLAAPTATRRSVAARVLHRSRGHEVDASDAPRTVTARERTVRPTRRWDGISAIALLGIAAGVGFEAPAAVLVGCVGVGYAAYARTRFPSAIALSATRALSVAAPRSGEVITVTVTVRNDGSRAVPDLRLIDGVPPALGVVDGSPRLGTTLPAGSETTFSYDVRARRGNHEFGPVRVLARDLAETVEVDLTVPADGSVTCRPPSRAVDDPSLRSLTTGFVGTVPASSAGEGLAFHSTRAYRRGDPIGRVDWNRFARTGSLSTVEYREERATTVVLVVDARETAAVAPAADAPTAVDRAADAAARLTAGLRSAGNAVGLAALAPGRCWISPRSDRSIERRIETALTSHPAFSRDAAAERGYTVDWVDEFRRRFDRPAQVLFLSPLCDDGSVGTARSLEAFGYPVTVVSPDPTTLETVGGRLAALEREIRLEKLRRAGIGVVNWTSGSALEEALTVARRRERP